MDDLEKKNHSYKIGVYIKFKLNCHFPFIFPYQTQRESMIINKINKNKEQKESICSYYFIFLLFYNFIQT